MAMHMADALISPAVGLGTWVAAAGIAGYSIKKVQHLDDHKIPLMGVMGAFIFTAQMINFAIPGTGSSGHLGGGLLLAVMLGPYAGFLTLTTVLFIQSLCFADGGLLALGCNILNLGFFPCFVVYPLIYRLITRGGPSNGRVLWGTLLAAVLGLQLGAFSVAVETFISGRTELPFSTFIMLLLPIHLAIGVVEGLVTASIILFIRKVRPEIIACPQIVPASNPLSLKVLLEFFIIAAILIAGFLSWFASSLPDGLEWSIAKTSGQEELQPPQGMHTVFTKIQQKTALLPDYKFTGSEDNHESTPSAKTTIVDGDASFAGLLGGTLTLLLTLAIGMTILWMKKRFKIKQLKSAANAASQQ
jgi:cobalt/nickel transport system permease protein